MRQFPRSQKRAARRKRRNAVARRNSADRRFDPAKLRLILHTIIHHRILRNLFLQKFACRAHSVVTHKPFLHNPTKQRVCAGDHTHTDMMRHIGTHHRITAVGRRGAPRCEIHGLVKAIASRQSKRLESLKIFHSAIKIKRER